MYLSYFHLKRKPFQISTDPRFLWLGDKHKEALATLKYGIQDNKGFLLLTGDVGTGKTTLINALLNSLDDKAVVATVPDPALSRLEFFQYVAFSFGIRHPVRSKVEFLVNFSQFLQEQADREQKVLLIIDEAQRLSHDLLEEIRLLSNIERQRAKLLNVFFIGQNEFNGLLAEPRNRALRQRITVNYHLDILSEQEVADYIRHRLIIAGSRRTLFGPDAIRQIHRFSGGYPRLINIICDRALLTCYVEDSKTVKAATVKECARELELPRRDFPIPPPNHHPGSGGPEKPHQPPGPGTSGKGRRWLYGGLAVPLMAGVAAVAVYRPDDQMFREVREVITGFGMEIRDRLPSISDGISREDIPAPAGEEQNALGGLPGENETESLPPLNEPDRHSLNEASKRNAESKVPEAPLAAGTLSRPEEKPDASLVTAAGSQESSLFMINFEINSSLAMEASHQELQRLARIMHQNPDLQAVAVGYTDTSGFYQYNLMISKLRADMVKGFLVAQGIGPQRIRTMGLGPEHPIASNENEAGRRLNRRVEIQLVGGS